MDQTLIFFLASIIIIGALLFFVICCSKKGTKRLDVEYYRAKCLEIEHQLKRDESTSYHMSVINADKLLQKALMERGFKGKTMGEKMKNANLLFGKNNNDVWSAHKLRNRIAHETDAHITYDDARYALACFRKALKDLGAI